MRKWLLGEGKPPNTEGWPRHWSNRLSGLEASKSWAGSSLAFRPWASCLTPWWQPGYFPLRKIQLKVAFTNQGIYWLTKLGSPKMTCFRQSCIQGLKPSHHDCLSDAPFSAFPSLALPSGSLSPRGTRDDRSTLEVPGMTAAAPGSPSLPAPAAPLEKALLLPRGGSPSPSLECHRSS